MRTAFDRVDVVDVGQQVLAVARVVFEADVDDRLHAGLVADETRHQDGLGDRRVVCVQVANEVNQTAAIGEDVLLSIPLVLQRDRHVGIQKCELAETFADFLVAKLDGLEDRRVGPEPNLRTRC